MPEKLKSALAFIWRLPFKSVLCVLLICVLYEGDLPMLTKTGPLPVAYLLLLGLAAVMVFFDRGLVIKFCVLLVIANMALRDNYPFSHFPMYARFTDHTYYVYVCDGEGKPIPIQNLTGIRTSKIKKPYDKDLDAVRKTNGKRKRELNAAEKEAAGVSALAQIWRNSNERNRERLLEHSPLKLYHVDIYVRDGKIDERPAEFIAELALPPK